MDAESRRAAFKTVQDSAEFQELRSRYRRFVFPVTGGALAFYFLYVLLAAYAPGFMGEKVVGNINVGLIFGLLQFVMVFGITAVYIRFARETLDPMSTKIRDDLEAGGLR
ncbi:MAG: DUF485 domain-containing protein [Solirubrobacteraceae bacterium]|nr:DUF485 domain-containing protein [Solirubrobacteraceae bacterium]